MREAFACLPMSITFTIGDRTVTPEYQPERIYSRKAEDQSVPVTFSGPDRINGKVEGAAPAPVEKPKPAVLERPAKPKVKG